MKSEPKNKSPTSESKSLKVEKSQSVTATPNEPTKTSASDLSNANREESPAVGPLENGTSTSTEKIEVVSSTGSVDEIQSNVDTTSDKSTNDLTATNTNKACPMMLKTVFTNPGHNYWKMKNPVVDKVFITDVKVDLNTVTIRECSTEKGFFRERQTVENKTEQKN